MGEGFGSRVEGVGIGVEGSGAQPGEGLACERAARSLSRERERP